MRFVSPPLQLLWHQRPSHAPPCHQSQDTNIPPVHHHSAPTWPLQTVVLGLATGAASVPEMMKIFHPPQRTHHPVVCLTNPSNVPQLTSPSNALLPAYASSRR